MSIVILGAGLAGLSAAYHLRKDYEIFEAESEAGGLCRSVKEDGFVFDYGPHLFFSKDKYFCKFLNDLMDKEIHELESSPGQFSFGTYLRYPYNVNLYGAPVDKIKECILGFVDVMMNKNRGKPSNYYEWCLYNYGKGYAYNFMFPYAKKIWTVHPKILTTDWIGKRIFMPTLEQILEGALHKAEHQLNYITTFKYPIKGGMSSFIAKLVKKVKPIHFNKKAIRIDIQNKKIYFQDGDSVSYKRIISSVPLPEVIKMIPDAPPSIREASKGLVNNSVFIINIGVNRSDLSEFQWIYFDGKEPFYRIHFPHMLSRFNSPRGNGAISIEIAYSKFRPINREGIVESTIKELQRAGILKSSDRIIYKDVREIKYAYVIYDHNRRSSVKKIRDYLHRHDIETCGRFGEWAYLWMDQSVLSGKRAAELVKATV